MGCLNSGKFFKNKMIINAINNRVISNYFFLIYSIHFLLHLKFLILYDSFSFDFLKILCFLFYKNYIVFSVFVFVFLLNIIFIIGKMFVFLF